MTAVASLALDYERVPDSGRDWSPAALRRRQAITHVRDRQEAAVGVDDAQQLAKLRRLLPRWPGRDQMLEIIDKIIDHPAVVAARGQKIGREGLRAIWRNDVIDAAQSGGLLRTSRRHAATRAGYKDGEKTVQKARQIGKLVGLYVELYRGRKLTLNERMNLWSSHDRPKQRGVTSIFAVGVFAPHHAARIATPSTGQFAEILPQDSPQRHTATPHLRSGSVLNLPHLLRELTSAAADAAGQLKTKETATRSRSARAGTSLAIEILRDPVLGRVFDGIRPGRMAGQLKPYEQAGWRPAPLVAALRREASTLRVSLWEPARSPFGLLKTLLRGIGIIPDVDAALYSPAPSSQYTTPPRSEPCGGVDCDGYGWINSLTDAGHSIARPCPDCAPAVRSSHVDVAALAVDDLPF